MVDTLTPVLTANWGAERSWTLASYEEHGGYAGLRTALGMAPDDVIAAFLRLAGRCHPEPEGFLVDAGKKLAVLLAGQLQRLNGILRRLSP